MNFFSVTFNLQALGKPLYSRRLMLANSSDFV